MIENHYVLITKESCEFCQEAIKLLKLKELSFIYTDMENAPQVLEATKIAAGHSTVPLIWQVAVEGDLRKPASNKFIGGYGELEKLLIVEASNE